MSEKVKSTNIITTSARLPVLREIAGEDFSIEPVTSPDRTRPTRKDAFVVTITPRSPDLTTDEFFRRLIQRRLTDRKK